MASSFLTQGLESSLGEDYVIGNQNIVGVQLVYVQNVNSLEVAHGKCCNIVGALDDDEQVLALGDASAG